MQATQTNRVNLPEQEQANQKAGQTKAATEKQQAKKPKEQFPKLKAPMETSCPRGIERPLFSEPECLQHVAASDVS